VSTEGWAGGIMSDPGPFGPMERDAVDLLFGYNNNGGSNLYETGLLL
jgi:hypothetical protein